MEYKLGRYIKTNRFTLGMLMHNTGSADTLELPDIGNLHDASCIPAGSYPLRTYTRPSGMHVIRVLDVPGRENIEIHEGNYLEQTDGCILTGATVRYRALFPYLIGSDDAFVPIYAQVLQDRNPVLVVFDLPNLDDTRTADVKAIVSSVL